MALAGLTMDNELENAKEAMKSNLRLWGYYNPSKALSGSIYGVPLHKFMTNREDIELLVAYFQFMLYNELTNYGKF